MRQAKIERKKFQSRISFILNPGKKIPRKKKEIKKLKNLFPTLFLAKTGCERPKKRKKNFSPEFRSNLAREENCEKNNKKILKIKKPISGIIFIQNSIGREREKKILVPNSVYTRPWEENCEKNSNKIKKLKNLFPAIFLAETG